MENTKSHASLSLDLDHQWSYMKTHGDPGWESFPSYLDTAVPRILYFLAERNLKITFFFVGQDAALEKNHDGATASGFPWARFQHLAGDDGGVSAAGLLV